MFQLSQTWRPILNFSERRRRAQIQRTLRFEPRYKSHPEASPSDALRAPNLREDSGQSERGRLRLVYCGRKSAREFRTGWKTEEQRGAIGNLRLSIEASKPCPQLKWRLRWLIYVKPAGHRRGPPRRPRGKSGNNFKPEGVACAEQRLRGRSFQAYL